MSDGQIVSFVVVVALVILLVWQLTQRDETRRRSRRHHVPSHEPGTVPAAPTARWSLRTNRWPPPDGTGLECIQFGSGDLVHVVGESQYQRALERVTGGRTREGHQFACHAYLIPEPENPHDANAVAVWIGAAQVGYLGRPNARTYRALLDRIAAADRVAFCSAEVVGGWDRGPHDRGSFGVRLFLPPLEEAERLVEEVLASDPPAASAS